MKHKFNFYSRNLNRTLTVNGQVIQDQESIDLKIEKISCIEYREIDSEIISQEAKTFFDNNHKTELLKKIQK